VKGAPKIAIVAGSKEDGNEIREKLILAGVTGPYLGNVAVSETGFSDYVRGEADEFLSSKD
jgi:hypothetical protein